MESGNSRERSYKKTRASPLKLAAPNPRSFRKERLNNKDQSRNSHCECCWPKENPVAEPKGTEGAQQSQVTKPGGKGDQAEQS